MKTEEQKEPIDIILITGFLGAGKTTFVNRLLSGKLGEGAGLLVNDFGDVVVDGSLIERNDSLDIYEVSGGSLFCSCKTANFAMGLKSLGKYSPTRVIVEASGMSDPSGMEKILTEYRMASDFHLARIICLTDAVRTPKMLGTLPALKRQIEAADLVLINKCDLVKESEISVFESQIQKLNPLARTSRTVQADVDMALLTGSVNTGHRGNIESCNLPGNRPESIQIEADGITRKNLDAFLREQLEHTWRIKGWTRADNRWWYVSDNAGRIEWSPGVPPAGMRPGLTVIMPPGKTELVTDAWRRFTAA
jgi:G3E family GTPase